MDLVSVLEPEGELLCVVGAGGKTTTMFALASRVGRAIVTSTVRIPIFDREVSDVVVTSDPVSHVESIDSGTFPLGIVPEREGENRYRGYDPEVVSSLAETHDGPVIVKADGARMRGFKAPVGDEPRIPDSTDVVVPVVSAHVVGKPLTGHWVHRPKRIATLTDTDLGEEITPETVATVIAHERGGLSEVPPGARLVPVITKVDSDEHETKAREIARTIDERFDSEDVILTGVALARFDVFESL